MEGQLGIFLKNIYLLFVDREAGTGTYKGRWETGVSFLFLI